MGKLGDRVFPYLLEDDVGVPATDSLDGGHGEHDVALAVNVGVHDTQNVLEVGWDDQRHLEAYKETMSKVRYRTNKEKLGLNRESEQLLGS